MLHHDHENVHIFGVLLGILPNITLKLVFLNFPPQFAARLMRGSTFPEVSLERRLTQGISFYEILNQKLRKDVNTLRKRCLSILKNRELYTDITDGKCAFSNS